MANSYKNIVITPNIGNTADPKIVFSGGNTTVNTDISMFVYPESNGTLSFEGSAGQLFSITNDLSGSIFSVNDISGLPSLEVFANGQINLAPYGGNVNFGNTSSSLIFNPYFSSNINFTDAGVTRFIATAANNSLTFRIGTTGQGGFGTRDMALSVQGGGYVRVDYSGGGTYHYDTYGSYWHMGYGGITFNNAGGNGATGPVTFQGVNYVTATTSFRAPIFYDSNDTGFYLDPASTTTSLQIAGAIEQGNNFAHPNIEWSASGASTGMVIFSLPGSTSNYGMLHMVFDVYEYTGAKISTVIVGGHNWQAAWYNNACQVIGNFDKTVRLGVKDGKYCVVFGGAASTWDYGTIRLRKIHNGGYYNNNTDLGGAYAVVQTTTESFTQITADLRYLRTPGTFQADADIRAPIFYDLNNTAYYINPASTSNIVDIGVEGDIKMNGSDSYIWMPSNNSLATGFFDPISSIVSLKMDGPTDGVYFGNSAWISYNSVNNNNYNENIRLFAASNGVTTIGFNATGASGVPVTSILGFSDRLETRFGNIWQERAYNGYVEASGSYRAPIFYDSNNTGFYVDPASFSNINSLGFKGRLAWQTADTSDNGLINLGYLLIKRGNKLYTDEDFNRGTNGIGVYNNAGGSALTVARTADATAPNSSRQVLRFTYNGGSNGTSPGLGGFFFGVSCTANRILVCTFKAKLPLNYTFEWASNATGTNSNGFWLTSNTGTGKYEEYSYVVMCGNTGSFSTTHFYYVNGTAPANGTVLFDIASATVWDITDNNQINMESIRAANDMRAPIFYDADNTAFFLDPNSTSFLSQARFNNRISIGDGNGTPYTNIGSPGIWLSYNGAADMFMGAQSSTVWGAYVGGDWRFSVNNSGTAIATGDVRAPIFYDSANTTFYVDPAGSTTSAYLNGDVYIAQGKITINRGSQSFTSYVEDDSSANGRAQLLLQSDYSDLVIMSRSANANRHGSTLTFATQSTANTDYAKWVICQGQYEEGANQLGFAYGTNTTNPHLVVGTDFANYSFLIQSGGLSYSSGASYAPIFYDLNNSAFYADPASTSVFNSLNLTTLNGNPASELVWRYTDPYGYDVTNGVRFYWVRIARLANSDAMCQVEIESKSDTNYSPYVKGVASFSTWNNNSFSAQFDLFTPESISSYVAIDNNNDIWIKCDSSWASYLRWRFMYTSGVTVFESANWQKTFTTVPTTHIVLRPGQAIRTTLGNVTSNTVLSSSTNKMGNLEVRTTGTAGTDFRAPVFYDSADTQYYWNPIAGGSHRFGTASGYVDIGPINTGFSHFQTDRPVFFFNKEIQVTDAFKIYGDTNNRLAAGVLAIRGTSPTVYFRDTDHFSGMIHVNSNYMYILRGPSDSESWSAINGQWPYMFNLNDNSAICGGIHYSALSHRSPGFYDSNDTNYYVDPAGTTALNNVYVYGGFAGIAATANYYDAGVEVREFNLGGAQTDTLAYAPRIGFHWSGRTAAQIAMTSTGRISILNAAGNGNQELESNNFYAPIFYDSNNTNYFVDPTSTDLSAIFNGSVVIGSTTAQYQATNRRTLTLNGANSAYITLATGDSPRLTFIVDNQATSASMLSGSNVSIAAQNASWIEMSTNSISRMFISSTGSIGIGNTAPQSKLVVSELKNGQSTTLLDLINPGTTVNTEALLQFSMDSGTSLATIAATRTVNNPVGSIIKFANRDTLGSLSEAMRISVAGNVGIGNTAPDYKLRVQGDISLSGGVHANGSFGTAGQVLTTNGTTSYWAPTVTRSTSIAMSILFG